MAQVLQNIDELFDREELSAAPDAGWPDCFNSGVFVFRPSEDTYNALLQFAMAQGSFDGMTLLKNVYVFRFKIGILTKLKCEKN
jgi:alpha-N-acetylglucosamine transferase